MDCCQCQGIEALFDGKMAKRELRQYRKKGPAKTTRILIEALKAEGIEGMTLLDIGGGIGAIPHELLGAGVINATNVDASRAYVEASREESERQGYAARVSYHHGNFVDLAPNVAEADIVTLDHVICCYHDVQALVDLSAARARQLYGLVYPQYGWLNKVVNTGINLSLWLTRNPMRSFLHRPDMVDAIVRSHGLRHRFHRNSFPWQIVIYGR
jgi:hypothetical protein